MDFCRNLHDEPLAGSITQVGPQLRSPFPVPCFLFLAYRQLAEAYPGSQPQDLLHRQQEVGAKFPQGENFFKTLKHIFKNEEGRIIMPRQGPPARHLTQVNPCRIAQCSCENDVDT